MPKLNQINALVTGRKTEAEKAVTDIYKILQHPNLFEGMKRTYSPFDEDQGEKLPPEETKVQQRVGQLVSQAQIKWSDLWNLTATQDAGNQLAKADIVIDNVKILADVPVTTLLFLEKQVKDLEAFIAKLPTPAIDETWTYDSAIGMLRSNPSGSNRTKKVPQAFQKAPATDKHPAQVEFFYEDVAVGRWDTVKFSGAMPADRKQFRLDRVHQLRDAIKVAREEANSIEVKPVKIADAIFHFVFDVEG